MMGSSRSQGEGGVRLTNGSRHVEKPWGFEVWWAQTDLYVGKLLHVEEGHRLSLQYHERKDESCYVLSGLVRVLKGPSVDDMTSCEMGPGTSWRNLPREIHTIEALQTSDILEASTPHLDDVVRLFDDYGRTAGGMADAATYTATPPEPVRLIDRDQLAVKLSERPAEVGKRVGDPGFPQPSGCFDGRMLWEESVIDAWLGHLGDAGDVVSARFTGSINS
jgi:mannose-6-phosphate isomerase